MRCVPLTATLCMPLLCAYHMHLAINYVNNEGKQGASLVAQLFTVIALSMVFFFPQHLFPKCLITNMLGWSFFALNPQMKSVAAAFLLLLQLTQLLWRAVVSVPDSCKLQ